MKKEQRLNRLSEWGLRKTIRLSSMSWWTIWRSFCWIRRIGNIDRRFPNRNWNCRIEVSWKMVIKLRKKWRRVIYRRENNRRTWWNSKLLRLKSNTMSWCVRIKRIEYIVRRLKRNIMKWRIVAELIYRDNYLIINL